MRFILYAYNETVEYELTGLESIEIISSDKTNLNQTKTSMSYSNGLVKTISESEANHTVVITDIQGRVISNIDNSKQTVNKYDSYGNLLITMEGSTSSFDSNYNFISNNKRFYLAYVYNDETSDGMYRENIIGINNEEAYIETKYKEGELNLVSKISSNVDEEYSYDSINRIIDIYSNNNSNHIKYNSIGQIEVLSGNKNHYYYEYDKYGNVSNVAIDTNGSKKSLITSVFDLGNNSKYTIRKKKYIMTNMIV